MEILELSCAITEKKNSLEGFGGISAQREERFCELKAVELILSEEQKGKRAKTMEQTQRGSGDTIKWNDTCVRRVPEETKEQR